MEFSVYVFERGKSSEAVMEAMKRAARRGVRIKCAVDGSAVSKFTRWCEGSTTLTDAYLHELQRAAQWFHFHAGDTGNARQVYDRREEARHGSSVDHFRWSQRWR